LRTPPTTLTLPRCSRPVAWSAVLILLGVPIGFREPRPLAASISKADIAQTCGNVRLNLWSVITRSPETNQCGEQEHEHQSGDDGDTSCSSSAPRLARRRPIAIFPASGS